jgi:tetratricopeptide (TPR) repeat protein
MLVAEPRPDRLRPTVVGGRFRSGTIAAALLVAASIGLAPVLGFPHLVHATVGRLVLPDGVLLSTDRRANKPAYRAHMAGAAAEQAGDHDAAVAHLSRAIRLYGADKAVAAASYRSRAYALERIGKLADALADYDKAIELQPEHSGTLRNRAHVLTALGRHAQALDDYEAALRIHPNSAGSQLGRGDVLVKLERAHEALAAYAQAADAAAAASYVQPSLRRNEVRLARWRADRDQLIALAHIRRGNIYRKLGQFEPALAEYGEALRVWPNHWSVYVNRGWLHEARGEVALARADYEKAAILRAPDDGLMQAIERTR